MRRWNGWGEEHTHYPFPDSAASYLSDRIGPGTPALDSTLEQSLKGIPASRLPDLPNVRTELIERLLHARGQSLPDWVALRSGKIGVFPDGVAYPEDETQVRALLDEAMRNHASLIPFGGGTSVVGHINPPEADTPVLTIDMTKLNRLIGLDETSRLATFEAGVPGPELERQLNAKGYTLGHYPQSFELSTLGGWIATRSSGQQSYHYGRIEDLFAGGRAETPSGRLELPVLPASAAGPDLRQLLLGSEGRLGIITQATVRIRPIPEYEAFYGIFFPEWEAGVEAVRQIAQEGVGTSMLRLSNARETETTLALSGKEELVRWADRGLRILGFGEGRCLLVFGATGRAETARQAKLQALSITRTHGGLNTGVTIGKLWRKSRFLTPYLRNVLWERGYAVDTLETALPWRQVIPAAAALQKAIHASLEQFNEEAWVFAHLSHVYADGASIYVTYLFRRAADPEETLRRWSAMKSAASRVILAQGGTISHQHGVGIDHAAYLPAEKGPLGMEMLRQAARAVDPDGMMNPGKLFEDKTVHGYVRIKNSQ
ncbi:MAG: FAD-linked oxidase [Chloroflexi bacterium RBG_16_57_11]|nr:MAG: FAD-linked oxidase [Chloroflexi bacterium RBG_16_57_11]